MADTVQITAGSGTTIATDDVSGVHYQRVKLVDGTLDSSTAVTATAGGALNVQNASLAGSVLATAVTVGTSAVALPASPLSGRRTLLVQSDISNSAYIYVGGSGVTSSTGIILTSGQTVALDVAGAAVYAIAGAASQTVRIIEVS